MATTHRWACKIFRRTAETSSVSSNSRHILLNQSPTLLSWFDFWRADFLNHIEENKEKRTDSPDGSRCAKRQIVQNSAAAWLSIVTRSTRAIILKLSRYILHCLNEPNQSETTETLRKHITFAYAFTCVKEKVLGAIFICTIPSLAAINCEKDGRQVKKKIECIKFCSIVPARNLRCAGGSAIRWNRVDRNLPVSHQPLPNATETAQNFLRQFLSLHKQQTHLPFSISLTWESGIDGNRAKHFHSYQRFKLPLSVFVCVWRVRRKREDVTSSKICCLIINGVGNTVRMQICSKSHRRSYALVTRDAANRVYLATIRIVRINETKPTNTKAESLEQIAWKLPTRLPPGDTLLCCALA